MRLTTGFLEYEFRAVNLLLILGWLHVVVGQDNLNDILARQRLDISIARHVCRPSVHMQQISPECLLCQAERLWAA